MSKEAAAMQRICFAWTCRQKRKKIQSDTQRNHFRKIAFNTDQRAITADRRNIHGKNNRSTQELSEWWNERKQSVDYGVTAFGLKIIDSSESSESLRTQDVQQSP